MYQPRPGALKSTVSIKNAIMDYNVIYINAGSNN